MLKAIICIVMKHSVLGIKIEAVVQRCEWLECRCLYCCIYQEAHSRSRTAGQQDSLAVHHGPELGKVFHKGCTVKKKKTKHTHCCNTVALISLIRII